MGHAAYRRKALDVLFPTAPGEDSDQRGSFGVFVPGVVLSRVHKSCSSFAVTSFHLAPDVRFREFNLCTSRKACVAYFCKRVPDLRKSNLFRVPGKDVFVAFSRTQTLSQLFGGILGVTWLGAPEATGVFLVRLRAVFRSGFRLDPIKSWRSESSTSCMSVSSFQRTRACGSTCCESGRLCAQAWQRRFDHNFLVSRPFWARQVSNRSSHYVLQNGQGAVSSIQLSVWSTVRSNLWSNLVNLGRIWSKLSKLWEMYPGPRFEGFLGQMDPSRAGNGSVKPRSNFGQPWSNLVNPGQTWSTLVKPWEMCPGPSP
uniref:Uncharacterized protein n=1 Tax=Fagus sylvatica TaxID=28930 RepID=A0A2N9F8F5_FAGSY